MKTKFLSVLAITAILFVSCGSDDEVTTEVNDGRVQFSSGVDAATPKVSNSTAGNTWTKDDPIGIYMVNNGLTSVVDEAENVKYTAYSLKSNNTVATFIEADYKTSIYYPVDINKKVDFFAYHPYNASVSNYVYPIDLSTQIPLTNIDLMLSQRANNAGAGYDKTNKSPINLVFDHQLVKVELVISKTAGVTGEDTDVKIYGMKTKAKFDMLTKAISDEDDIATIVPDRFGGTSNTHFYAILLPVTLNDSHVIEFTIGGDTYKWTINNPDNTNNYESLEGGKVYTFNVKLTKYRVEVTGTINQWEPAGGMTSGTAD